MIMRGGIRKRKISSILLLVVGLLLLGVATIIYAATPIANAGPDQVAGPGDVVQLDGTGSTGDGLQFNWTQISGLSAVLTGADTMAPTFIFPVTDVMLIFELTVTDGTGITDTDTVTIIPEVPAAPPSLKTVPVPEPDNLMDYVQDREAAIALGKTLFWDMQVGSDGTQACASCHYHAGVDNRATNRLHPGSDGAFQITGPAGALQLSDFPFHQLADPADRNSAVLSDSDDVAGGQGVPMADFLGIVVGGAVDDAAPVADPIFNANGVNVHQVTGRDTPTVINAVFNVRSFWDGRANFVFNGVNPFGQRDPNAHILEAQPNGDVIPVTARLQRASLASQAVGPPNSSVEMAWNGRTFPDIGKKMLNLTPLGQQTVHPNDSVLGSRADASGPGLNTSYEAMIMAAFLPQYWDSDKIVVFDSSGSPTVMNAPGRPLNADEYTLMEANFSLFFGLAVQLYEATLVSDDAPFDQFQEGNDNALTGQQQRGLDLFIGQAGCIACHNGAEFTAATVSHIIITSNPGQEEEIIERMVMGDGGVAIYDNAFYNIGVRSNSEDVGVGGFDPFGNPLSFTRLAQQGIPVGPPFNGVNPAVNPAERAAVNGAFKTPTLRNIELTAPYMHNGGMATLEQVVAFYNRGGDFHDENFADLAPNIGSLGLSQQDMADLVAFLRALTDERVRLQQAPFDHPQLFIPNGGGELLEIPAVGAGGGPPLQPFVDIHPDFQLTLTVDKPIMLSGQTAQYTVAVENTGDTNLDNTIIDSNLAGCNLVGPMNDNWGTNILEVGEIWTYTCSVTLVEDATNTVTITVQDKLNNPLTGSSVATVDVIHPGIHVSQTAEAQIVSPGSDATFTINVVNMGDVDLTNVTAAAPLAPSCAATFLTLAAGDSETYTCTASNVTAGFTNVVQATGYDTAGNSWSNSAGVDVIAADNAFYFSLGKNSKIDGISYSNEDILFFDGANFTQFFDGSDLALGPLNLDAFYIVDADTILMSFQEPAMLAGIGEVDDSDIVRFNATLLGETTIGTFSLFFDGSTVGLSSNNEDIDAMTLLADGRLLISTIGTTQIPGLRAEDEDLVVFTPTVPGDYLSGATWDMYLDGSDVDLKNRSEDINGVAIAAGGNIYLTTLGNFRVSAVSGRGEDVFECESPVTGSASVCSYAPTLYFDGSAVGMQRNTGIDAMAFPAQP